MFSVIIPLYNKAPYIEKALRSVQAQTFREFEVIVIDDGSTDINAPQPPKRGVQLTYSDLNKLLNGKGQVVRQENQGVSTARNNGVKLAKYPYICFLDADDWWEPTFLEEMKGLIEEFPEAGIYGTSYYIVKNGNYRVAPIGVDTGFEKGLINYCHVYAKTLCMPLWTGAVCIPKTIYDEEKGFKSILKLGEDFDLWVRIAMKYPVALLNKPLANYNQDVDLTNRALKKVYPIENNYLWDSEFQDNYNQNNLDLKKLLDNIRAISVFRYYLSKEHKKNAITIIEKINWDNVNHRFYKKYIKLPYFWLKVKYFILWEILARKNRIIRFRKKLM